MLLCSANMTKKTRGDGPVVVAQNPCIRMATLSTLGPNVGQTLFYFQKTRCVITPKYDTAYS